jgi:hypothetical protein
MTNIPKPDFFSLIRFRLLLDMKDCYTEASSDSHLSKQNLISVHLGFPANANIESVTADTVVVSFTLPTAQSVCIILQNAGLVVST